jgi:homoserine O-succinyltransferase/O-acetyltransferase
MIQEPVHFQPIEPNSVAGNINQRSRVHAMRRTMQESNGAYEKPRLNIGLVNNMPDSALESTERQFTSLLESAGDGMPITLTFYALPGVPRSAAIASRMQTLYRSTDELRETGIDAIIVTGREPLAADLAEEPYWESFTQLLEWARANTYSSVWSCLAAHAAVQHLDGIRRVRSDRKHCGIFECTRASEHFLIDGTNHAPRLAHSRWNGLPEEQLLASGYQLLMRAAGAGVDTFCRAEKSLLLFFQGHPEYETNTLMLEYRRDVVRYLRSETDKYPSIPRNYFDEATAGTLIAIQHQAEASRSDELLERITAVLADVRIENVWRPTAVSIYRNWLQFIAAQKYLDAEAGKTAARAAEADVVAVGRAG